MASVNKDGKGWRVRFIDVAGDQKTLRPGKGTTKAAAEQLGRHVDSLVASQMAGISIDRQTADWIGRIGAPLRKKLERAGLVEPLQPEEPKPVAEKQVFELGKFLAEYRDDGRTGSGERAAELTVTKWRAPMNALIQFFGYDRDITTITHEDAHQYRKWLDARRIRKSDDRPNGVPLAENTRRKHIDNAKVFFNGAKRRGLISFNPFEHQTSSTKPNRERDFFLPRDQTERILSACPDAEWRLLVALWRYAGLRKMEIFGLTWGDVLKDQGRMRVHSTKTAHHEGRNVRYVPLWDIQKHLEDVFQQQLPNGKQSLPPDTPIVTRFSKSNSNLDKPFKAILHRAGIVPWPKLFQNMRASCETEWLNEGHPAHVIAGWIGHSVKVQRDSYAQITDGHYDKFNAHLTENNPQDESGLSGGLEDVRTGENPSEVAYPVAYSKPSKNAENQSFSYPKRMKKVAVEGLEPTSENTGFGDTADAGGLSGGLRPEFLTRFCDELRTAGFTADQIRAIDSAMQAAGVCLSRPN